MTETKCDMCDKEFASKDALNMHNRSKHPELHKEPWLSNKLKKRIKYSGVVLLIILAIIAFSSYRSYSFRDAPVIEINPVKYNFGDVSQAKGEVSTTMIISNQGKSDLIINNMDTSCGCTSAAIIYEGVESPRFSMAMHGTNPKDWKQVIKPGETAQLKVYYNPNVHKDMRGAVTRSVFISSNDHRSKKKEVRISANQVD